MRRMSGVVASALLATVGCGPVDAGSAFAEQFEPYLASNEAVETFTVYGDNTLPWTGGADVDVTMVAGLSDEELVEEVWAITHHEVEHQIGYSLVIRFPSVAGDGAPATTSLSLSVDEPAPDDGRAREQIAERVRLGRDVAALGRGPTTFEVGSWDATLTTDADPVATATALDRLIDETGDEWSQHLTVASGPAILPDGSVEFAAGETGGALAELRTVLDAAAALGPVESWTADVTHGQPTTLNVVYATRPADLVPLTTLAAENDVALTVV
ncbi:MAG: hypothetical protein QM621_00495 [Aeromicrobium sp.]|uniref:hypothetical protein n=1 Tax=Aeromicrobium sp. TaxID=1871063 RepID=UPI0039E6F732